MTTNPEYQTKDLPLAAVLKLDGVTLIRVENYSGKAFLPSKFSKG